MFHVGKIIIEMRIGIHRVAMAFTDPDIRKIPDLKAFELQETHEIIEYENSSAC